MARPERNNVDYFPFICEEGNKMFYLEEQYGNDGFAVFIKLLRELAKTNYHYLNLSKQTTLMYLSAKCKVQQNLLNNIIGDLVELEKFDKSLWDNYKVIWCQDLIDSIQDAYKRRKNDCIDYDGLLTHLKGLSNPKPSKSLHKGGENPEKDSVKPQTKEEYTKEEYTKEDNEVNINILKSDNYWIENICNQNNISPAEIFEKLDEFKTFLKSTFKEHETKEKLAAHFYNWLPKNLKSNGNNEPRVNRQTSTTIRKNSQGW